VAGGGAAGTCWDYATSTWTRYCGNQAAANFSTIGGGFANRASGSSATVGGGNSNTANIEGATVGGGTANHANGYFATVGGGWGNTAGPFATVGGGDGNTASNLYATVAGGYQNAARGNYSFAAGRQAKVRDAATVGNAECDLGTFLWADASDFDFTSTGANQFGVRATGGVRFVTAIDGAGAMTRQVAITNNGELKFNADRAQMVNLFGTDYGIGVQDFTQYFRTGNNAHFAWYGSGAHANAKLDPGQGGVAYMTLSDPDYVATIEVVGHARAQSFVSTSDRNAKTAFAPVDTSEVLRKVVALPVETWAYRTAPRVRHLGPTSQDFQAAFGLGHDDKGIATVDADGVALAAIQGLNAKLEQALAARDRRIAELEAKLAAADALRAELAALRAALTELTAERTRLARSP
jgi:hypothetical protein